MNRMARGLTDCEVGRTDLTPVDESLLGDPGRLIDIRETSETGAAKREALPEPTHQSSSRLAERAATAAVMHANLGVSRYITQAPENTPMITTAGHLGMLEQIRKVENENARLHNLVRKCQAEPNGHEATIDILTTSFNACCSDRDEKARQLTDVLNYLGALQQENDDLKKTGRELKLSASQHATLQKENEELKIRILKLSPSDVVSDAQLNEKYENLCGDIEDWVDTQLGDVEDVVKSVFIGTEKQGWEGKFLRYVDIGLWKMLKANDASQLKFLVCMIQRFVTHRILSRYAFGVSGGIVEGLSTIEKQMRASAGAKDFEHIYMWRADALRALFEAPSVVGSRQQKLETVTLDAWHLLEPLFPKTVDQKKAMTVFHNRITLVAWELSSQLRTSPVEYSFGMGYVEGTRSTAKALYREDRECSILLDADTGSKLRRSTDIIFDSAGSFGQGLCVVFPVLVRNNPQGQDVKIGKATLLVKLNKRQHASGLRGLLRTVTG